MFFNEEQSRFLATHHGVMSRSEALAHGISRGQLQRLVTNGTFERVQPAVYRLAAAPKTWRAELRAAVVSCDGAAAASHRAAASLWEIDGFDRAPVEVVHWNTKRLTRAGVKVHFSTQMHLADVEELDGIDVTGPGRTVLDLFAILSPNRRVQALDAFLRSGMVDIPELYDVVVRHSIQGRTGVGRLRLLLDSNYGHGAVPDSRWNRMVGQLLEAHGLPAPSYEYEIFDQQQNLVGRVDLAFPSQRVAIELDSVRWHLNRESFTNDPRRRNRLQLVGWQILTFTWPDYADTPEQLVATVSKTLTSDLVRMVHGRRA